MLEKLFYKKKTYGLKTYGLTFISEGGRTLYSVIIRDIYFSYFFVDISLFIYLAVLLFMMMLMCVFVTVLCVSVSVYTGLKVSLVK